MRLDFASLPILVASTIICAASERAVSEPAALAKQLLPAKNGGKLQVMSDALTFGGSMDERFTQDGDNHSPPVTWGKGPTGTVGYVLLVEDSAVDSEPPVAHWIVYDIPGSTSRIAENQPKDAELSSGAMQGLNARNEIGFIGPKPPAGQTHNYHIQVFALNKRVRPKPEEADREHLLQAMKGHVLASGDLVVRYTGK